MNRKQFFKVMLPATLATLIARQSFANPFYNTEKNAPALIPPYLKRGDTVGITCPAGPVDSATMQPCVSALKKWGLNVKYGNTVGKVWQRFGGTDKERLEDFQALIDDDTIQAIIFGKGGYGTMRIIDKVNWQKFIQKPKWLIGYSDLTVVHAHVQSNYNIPTIHGDMSTGFSNDPLDSSTFSLQQALFGNPMEYSLKSFSMNRPGTARGILVGGNLSLIHACAASTSDLKTDGKILFVEDVSEYKYTIDRMLMSMKRSGKLDNLAGLIVGGFTATKEDGEDNYSIRIEDIIFEKIKEYKYPVCFHFPAGHMRENRALKLGVPYDFTVGREIVSLIEIRNIGF